MKRTDFSYELPPELIAQEPRERGRSRMMVVTPSTGAPQLEHSSFDTFPERLGAGDVLVINDTRVIPARLFAQPKGAMTRPIELLLTEARDAVTWEAWCRPAKRVHAGDVLRFSDALTATVLEKSEGTVVVRFDGDLAEIDRIGVMPLPPYIARDTPRASDREAYQTVYAGERGAIAAPTAGLHFTPEILERVAARGVETVRVTLHVGIGTFAPVKVDDVAEHKMHSERYEISEAAAASLNRALDERRTIVAVGTTSVRTLESAILAGDGRIPAGRASTSIFITPGFRFRAVDKLLTNFHLPESTLLMLVSAFAGIETIRAAYAEAVRERYAFFSYGDCMLLTRDEGRGTRDKGRGMRVRFDPLGRSADAHPNETILDVARRAGAPLGNSCGAIGICARCRIRVVEGAEHLSPPTTIESRVSAQRAFAPDERLACQAVVQGDCVVTTTYW